MKEEKTFDWSWKKKPKKKLNEKDKKWEFSQRENNCQSGGKIYKKTHFFLSWRIIDIIKLQKNGAFINEWLWEQKKTIIKKMKYLVFHTIISEKMDTKGY